MPHSRYSKHSKAASTKRLAHKIHHICFRRVPAAVFSFLSLSMQGIIYFFVILVKFLISSLMKRVLLIIASASMLLSCSKEPAVVELSGFTDTGCGRGSLAALTKSGEDRPSELVLEYTASGLTVTHHNAVLNCSINNGGIGCDFSVDGNVIRMRTYEKNGEFLKCLCPVDEMKATLSGLVLDTEYVLEYACSSTRYVPINFRFEKGLKKTIDLDTYVY